MKKTKILINKSVYLGLLILDTSKTVMYEFWCDYVKPKYGEKGNLCYVDTDSFIDHIKRVDIHVDIVKDVETRSYTSNDELDRPLPKRKNLKSNERWIKQICCIEMKEFVALGPKTYRYLTDDGDKDKKAKDASKCGIKRNLKFQDCKHCLEASQIEYEINQLEKNKRDVDNLRENHKEFIKTINNNYLNYSKDLQVTYWGN